jgi:hypothetical protein
MVTGIGRSLLHLSHYMRGCRKIGIAYAQIDEIEPFLSGLFLLLVDPRKRYGGSSMRDACLTMAHPVCLSII